jgi:hypothetical protein
MTAFPPLAKEHSDLSMEGIGFTVFYSRKGEYVEMGISGYTP